MVCHLTLCHAVHVGPWVKQICLCLIFLSTVEMQLRPQRSSRQHGIQLTQGPELAPEHQTRRTRDSSWYSRNHSVSLLGLHPRRGSLGTNGNGDWIPCLRLKLELSLTRQQTLGGCAGRQDSFDLSLETWGRKMLHWGNAPSSEASESTGCWAGQGELLPCQQRRGRCRTAWPPPGGPSTDRHGRVWRGAPREAQLGHGWADFCHGYRVRPEATHEEKEPSSSSVTQNWGPKPVALCCGGCPKALQAGQASEAAPFSWWWRGTSGTRSFLSVALRDTKKFIFKSNKYIS